MSYCRQEGKDQIIFLTEEDYKKTSSDAIPDLGDLDDEPGLILENGEINWNCPCLGGMATGPCGNEFREAFSCFHYSEADPKGSDCIEQFRTMQSCMMQYPTLYENEKEEEAAGNDPTEEELSKMTGMADSENDASGSVQDTSTSDSSTAQS